VSRLGHAPRCRCGDCGIEATRRHIAQMECELGLCDHRAGERHVTPPPPDPRAKPGTVRR